MSEPSLHDVAALKAAMEREVDKTVTKAFGWFGLTRTQRGLEADATTVMNILDQELRHAISRGGGVTIFDQGVRSTITPKDAALVLKKVSSYLFVSAAVGICELADKEKWWLK